MLSNEQNPSTLTNDVKDGTIGERLRLRRKVRNLSLKDVSEKAGVSVGLLSQIERGLTMPSVRSLSAICAALEMPVSWLFDLPNDKNESALIVRRHQRRVLDLGPTRMIKELMTPDNCSGIQMMQLTLKPGGSSGDKAYNHQEGVKCGSVLSGALGLEVDGETYCVEAGDSFAFSATRMIRFWCEGAQETVVLWVVTPAVY